jgi:hypothetical protein
LLHAQAIFRCPNGADVVTYMTLARRENGALEGAPDNNSPLA